MPGMESCKDTAFLKYLKIYACSPGRFLELVLGTWSPTGRGWTTWVVLSNADSQALSNKQDSKSRICVWETLWVLSKKSY